MMALEWRERLQWLIARFPEQCVGADLAALSTAEAWGLFRYLSRLAEGA
jgi:hypothetical protein